MIWHCHDCFHGMPPGACAGGIAVVIDVLRASTTIVTALAHGAERVRPVRTIEEARGMAAECRGLLGGERGGRPIDGFDFGNSPLEYSARAVAGRALVITTTNGTAAIHACADAADILIGSVVNRSAVAALARRLADEHGGCDVHLVCAGTDGAVTEEDRLGAGAILDAAVEAQLAAEEALDAPARAALADYRAVTAGAVDTAAAATALARAFATSIGGRNLIEIGMAADLAPAAAIDALAVVPRLDRGSGWLHAVGPRAG